MSNPIKIGLVGLGRAGKGMHLAEIKNKTDKFQVVAVCDILPERAQVVAEMLGCRAYTSIDELIADKEVELVDIATRTVDHFEHSVKALKAGKMVFIEKPVTMNYEQTKELFDLANRPDMPNIYVRQNRRFEVVFNKVWEAMRSGKLGKVFEINIRQLSFQRRDDWQTINEFGGGQLLNWGPHIIDHSLRLLESPVASQTGSLMLTAAGGDCEDHFSIHFIGENGRKVNMWISGGTASMAGRYFEVFGTKGSMICNNNDIMLKYINPEQVLPPVISDPGTPGDSFGSSGTFEAAVNPEWIEEEYKITSEDLTVIWDYLYETIRNGAEFPIKQSEVLELMRAVTNLKEEKEIINFTAE